MTFENAQNKIIICYEAGNTMCLVVLLLRFGSELLSFLTAYIKQKHESNLSEN